MTVKLFRLVTGDDIIATVKEPLFPNESQILLETPAVIVLQKTAEGVGVAVAPYMPMVDGVVTLNRSAIVSEGIPDAQLVNEYNVRFGSGLVVAQAGSVPNLR